MVEKTTVHIDYLIVGAKNIIQRTDNPVIRSRNLDNPLFKSLIIKLRGVNTRGNPLKSGRHII